MRRRPQDSSPQRQHFRREVGRGEPLPEQPPEWILELRFRYNARFWALAAPSIAVNFLIGGRPLLLAASAGFMLCYVLDVSDAKDGAVVAFLVSMIGNGVVLIVTGVSHGFMPLFSLQSLLLWVHLCLLVLWGGLQFRFFLREEPESADFLEKLLFALWPLPAAAVITWGAVLVMGPEAAATVLLVVLYATISLYSTPLPSMQVAAGAPAAPRRHHSAVSAVSIEDRARGTVHFASVAPSAVLIGAFLVLPAATHLAVHRSSSSAAFSLGFRNDESLFTELVVLAALPPLLLFASLAPRGALWWLSSPPARISRAAALIVPAAGALVFEGFATLFLLEPFRPYFAPSPPWDRLCLSGAVYFAVAAPAARKLVKGPPKRGMLAMRLLAVASSRCFGALFGVHWAAQPLFDTAALGLASFVDSGQASHYAAAALGAGAAVLWFSRRTLWFLSYSFALGSAGRNGKQLSLSLESLTVGIAALAVLTLAVPGLAAAPRRQVPAAAAGAAAALHAAALAFTEAVLTQAPSEDYAASSRGGENEVYPKGFVLATGAAGLWMTAKLAEEWKLWGALWPAACLHAGKLAAALATGFAEAFSGRASATEATAFSFLHATGASAAVLLSLAASTRLAATTEMANISRARVGGARATATAAAAQRNHTVAQGAPTKAAALFVAFAGALACAYRPLTLPFVEAAAGRHASAGAPAALYAAAASLAAAAAHVLSLSSRYLSGTAAKAASRFATVVIVASGVVAAVPSVLAAPQLPLTAAVCLIVAVLLVSLAAVGSLPKPEGPLSRSFGGLVLGGLVGAAAADAAALPANFLVVQLVRVIFVVAAALAGAVVLELKAPRPPRPARAAKPAAAAAYTAGPNAAKAAAVAPAAAIVPELLDASPPRPLPPPGGSEAGERSEEAAFAGAALEEPIGSHLAHSCYVLLLLLGPAVLGVNFVLRSMLLHKSRVASIASRALEGALLALLLLCHALISLAAAAAGAPIQLGRPSLKGEEANAQKEQTDDVGAGSGGTSGGGSRFPRGLRDGGERSFRLERSARKLATMAGRLSPAAAYLFGALLAAEACEGEGALAAALALLSLVLLLQRRPSVRVSRASTAFSGGPNAAWAAPLACAAASWTLTALYYILVKDLVRPWPSWSGAIAAGSNINNNGAIGNGHPIFDASLARALQARDPHHTAHLRAVSLWNRENALLFSPIHLPTATQDFGSSFFRRSLLWPLWNLALLAAATPAVVRFHRFLRTGKLAQESSSDGAGAAAAAAAAALLPAVGSALAGVRCMAFLGAAGGAWQLWGARRRLQHQSDRGRQTT